MSRFTVSPYKIKGIVLHYKCWLSTNEPAHAHTTNENWAWQWTANKFVSHIQVYPQKLSLQRVRRCKHRICSIALAYLYSYPLAVHSWRLWASQLDRQQNLCAAHVRPPHIHCTTILGMPILPVPTLIELLSSLRSKYTLYSGTMSLMTPDYTFLVPKESDTICPEETLRGNYSSRR